MINGESMDQKPGTSFS